MPVRGKRAYLTSQNPVAAALFFEKIIRSSIKYLLGIDITPSSKTMTPLSARQKGVLSLIVAYYGVIECQGRGTLHTHIFLWGALPPYLLQKCAAYDELVESLRHSIDSMVTAEISKEGYDNISRRRQISEPLTRINCQRRYPSLFECPAPTLLNWDAAFRRRFEDVATAVQVVPSSYNHMNLSPCHF